jgi:uncharacterized OB-fold protein
MDQEPSVSEGTVRMLLTSSQVVRSQQGYALLGARCGGCGTIAFPVLSSCPRCGGTGRQSSMVPSRGRLYVHTRVHIARPGVKVPYVVVGAAKKKRGKYEYFFRPVEAV